MIKVEQLGENAPINSHGRDAICPLRTCTPRPLSHVAGQMSSKKTSHSTRIPFSIERFSGQTKSILSNVRMHARIRFSERFDQQDFDTSVARHLLIKDEVQFCFLLSQNDDQILRETAIESESRRRVRQRDLLRIESLGLVVAQRNAMLWRHEERKHSLGETLCTILSLPRSIVGLFSVR